MFTGLSIFLLTTLFSTLAWTSRGTGYAISPFLFHGLLPCGRLTVSHEANLSLAEIAGPAGRALPEEASDLPALCCYPLSSTLGYFLGIAFFWTR